jgi:hypothetical protein
MAGHTRIGGHNYHFAVDAEEGNIVPHNPSLLTSFQAHHCLEVTHSEQCIGYVLKHCAKNSDARRISLQNVLYEGYSVTRVTKLQYYAATRISSASGCFGDICRYWRHYMKPTVHVLRIHFPGRKSYYHLGPVTLWKRLISHALLKDISVTRSTLHRTNRLISTITLGILSIPVQPPVTLIKVSANLSASPIEERILQFVSCVQFTHGCMNFLP